MRVTLFMVSVLAVAMLSTSATVSTNAVETQPQLMQTEVREKERQQRKCRSARTAVVFYRTATHAWQLLREAEKLAGPPPLVRGKSCSWARHAASEWQARARSAKRSYRKWVNEHTLRDYRFAEGNEAWAKAVRQVQRVFPGTESWLLSCSGAEGGHGRWVGYSGVAYSTRLRDSDTVGGPMQYRWSTFKGHFRHGLDYLGGKGFRVPMNLLYRGDDDEWMTIAWRSALGQAIAAGWARYTGNDSQHWIASWSNGCR